jgi:hypothetical protein
MSGSANVNQTFLYLAVLNLAVDFRSNQQAKKSTMSFNTALYLN